jgi:uncharacterized integral membrane protein
MVVAQIIVGLFVSAAVIGLLVAVLVRDARLGRYRAATAAEQPVTSSAVAAEEYRKAA